MAFVKIGSTSEVAVGAAKLFESGGKRICVFNLGGKFYAIDDMCTHEGGPLCEGVIEGDEVECPWHAARFDIKTGEARGGPAYEGVAAYRLRVNGENLEVDV
jgi:nitrite reductase/ring-hydroxylating ferredoxin subunit